MKKIFLIPVLLFVLIGCTKSTNEEVTINPIQLKLKGSWENAGYYDDVVNPESPENDNYYPSPNGVTISYNSETYSSTYFGNPYQNGNFSVSNDSILNHDSDVIGKIITLNNSELIIRNMSQLGGIRFIRVETTAVNGKR